LPAKIKLMKEADKEILKAKNKAEQESDISVVLEYTDTARTYLQNAETNAKVARAVLEEVIESRNKARIAGATKLEEDYHEVENQFLSLTQAIEKDNVGYAQKNAPDVDKAFKKVELRAIKIETIGEVKIILNQAEEDTPKKKCIKWPGIICLWPNVPLPSLISAKP
jgi:OOP family OmpA-OmpF porin